MLTIPIGVTGDIGENSRNLINYFERNGATPCLSGVNPAEWMLEAICAAPGSSSKIDWHEKWRASEEYHEVLHELGKLRAKHDGQSSKDNQPDAASYDEFAASFWQQFLIVTRRTFQHSWHSPAYIYSKLALCTICSLFIGLVFFNAPLTIQGLQNQMFAIFELMSIIGQLVEQQMPNFVIQRSLYEVRERPAKTYSWKVFMLSQIISEIPWMTLSSLLMWALFYYPVGFYKNADVLDQGTERGLLMWLLFWVLLIWVSTFAHMCVSFSDSADGGGNVANSLFIFIFFFCGVLASPDQMPRFWIFLYRVSPLSYFVSATLSTALGNIEITCAENEFITLAAPDGQTCDGYLSEYISRAGGYLLDSNSTSDCYYCKLKDTNAYLAALNSEYDTRWRNFGIMWAYIAFNIGAAMILYWIVRMPKGKKKTM
jgi:ATP-binding cassette subfamily G (WHITE) protein 2 (PDR)